MERDAIAIFVGVAGIMIAATSPTSPEFVETFLTQIIFQGGGLSVRLSHVFGLLLFCVALPWTLHRVRKQTD